jgi:hypothetical protein
MMAFMFMGFPEAWADLGKYGVNVGVSWRFGGK